jgi:hypothetical protein
VLGMVGEYLGGLAGSDLARRCALGSGADRRTDRKRELTALSSSRWAGAITRTSNDQWQRGWRNLLDARVGLGRSIRVIQRGLAVPIGQRQGRVRGYATRQERWAKQQRLQRLQASLARVERRLAAGRVSVCRGGRRLARLRHGQADGALAPSQWRQRWTAERWFLCADGEADKHLGNETIRVHPQEGWLEVRLPTPLAYLANTRRGRYRLSCPVRFTHRSAEWAAQAASGAVRYDIDCQPERGRWYLSASWRQPAVPAVPIQQALADGVLAVDLNAGHLACWQVDRHGNPVVVGVDIPLALAGLPASARDGRLRAAISTLLELARERGCTAIGIENLDFTDARQVGRETLGRGRRGKQFRRVVAGIPTRQLRDRLTQMAANRQIAVVAMDPGWTSVWGQAYWQRPLQARHPNSKITRHHAACVVLGRRALGLKARRRPGVPAPHQRMDAAGTLPAGAESYRPGRADIPVRAGHDPPVTRPGSPSRSTRPAAATEHGPTSRGHKTVRCHRQRQATLIRQERFKSPLRHP